MSVTYEYTCVTVYDHMWVMANDARYLASRQHMQEGHWALELVAKRGCITCSRRSDLCAVSVPPGVEPLGEALGLRAILCESCVQHTPLAGAVVKRCYKKGGSCADSHSCRITFIGNSFHTLSLNVPSMCQKRPGCGDWPKSGLAMMTRPVFGGGVGFVGDHLDCGLACISQLTGESAESTGQKWIKFCRWGLIHRDQRELYMLVQAWGCMLEIARGPRGSLRSKINRILRKVERELAEQDIQVHGLQHMRADDAMKLITLCLRERLVPISPTILIHIVSYSLFVQNKWATLHVRIDSENINTVETQVGKCFVTIDGERVSNVYDGVMTAALMGRHWEAVTREETGYDSEDGNIVTQTVLTTTGPDFLVTMIGLGERSTVCESWLGHHGMLWYR